MVRQRTYHGGMTLLEVIVGTALLATILSVTAQSIVQLKRHRRSMDKRAVAVSILENSLEAVTAQSWERIDDQAVAAIQLPASVVQRWPSAKIMGAVSIVSKPVTGKRVTLTVTLDAASAERPLSLTTWVFRR
jgi:type II secretory pathway pseudopilin PulG